MDDLDSRFDRWRYLQLWLEDAMDDEDDKDDLHYDWLQQTLRLYRDDDLQREEDADWTIEHQEALELVLDYPTSETLDDLFNLLPSEDQSTSWTLLEEMVGKEAVKMDRIDAKWMAKARVVQLLCHHDFLQRVE